MARHWTEVPRTETRSLQSRKEKMCCNTSTGRLWISVILVTWRTIWMLTANGFIVRIYDSGRLCYEQSANDTKWNKSVCFFMVHTGCPISKFPLCFCNFLGFWSTYRGTSDMYSIALEICYMIATRILKIDLEIAEIIEVKVGTCDTKIIFLTLCNSKMSISKWRVPTLTSNISAISKSIFKILVAIM